MPFNFWKLFHQKQILRFVKDFQLFLQIASLIFLSSDVLKMLDYINWFASAESTCIPGNPFTYNIIIAFIGFKSISFYLSFVPSTFVVFYPFLFSSHILG